MSDPESEVRRFDRPATGPPPWRVIKLGGTTVADASALVAACARARRLATGRRVALVVSALAGVTDTLERLARERGDRSALGAARRLAALDALAVRHRRLVERLSASVDGETARRLLTATSGIAEELERLRALLRGPTASLRSAGDGRDGLVVSTGERIAARIVQALVAPVGAELVDGGSLLVARGCALDAAPDLMASRRSTHGRLATCRAPLWVVPGFFARDAEHRFRLLGRGGSDTSATLLGAALGADLVEIWTDVDGVYDVDPRRSATARRFDSLDYDEAERLARAGARVLHERSLAPAREAGVPIVVRDSFHPERSGTRIGVDLRGLAA